MGAPSKRARKVRNAAEFDVARLTRALTPPRTSASVYAWTLAEIFSARDAQMRGQFAIAARLAESLRTDDALFVAYENRLAPQRCIKVELCAAPGARGAPIAAEAEALFGQAGVGIHPDTISDIHGCLVNHGVAFAVNVATPREDGSRVDFELRAWPIEFVRWDAYQRCFMARVEPTDLVPGETTYAGEVPIVHGDGRWVVFRKNEIEPFKSGALVAAALVWARHAYAIRDWAKSSIAHGSAKVVGELPTGVALQSADGTLTPEALAFADLLSGFANSDSFAGIRPAGSKSEFVTNTSTAWQVFAELVRNGEQAAARVYLGTDGALGSVGGAPGVDIQTLMGVAATLVEGDLRCIERGLLTGTIEPWCAVNHGDSSLAPKRRYLLADADADAARAAMSARRAAFFADIAAARENRFDITQSYVDEVAKMHGVDAPSLPPQSAPVAAPVAAPPALRSVT